MKYEIEVCTKESDSTTISVERRGDKLVIQKNLDEVFGTINSMCKELKECCPEVENIKERIYNGSF